MDNDKTGDAKHVRSNQTHFSGFMLTLLPDLRNGSSNRTSMSTSCSEGRIAEVSRGFLRRPWGFNPTGPRYKHI